jgi:prevent-host-death family protein
MKVISMSELRQNSKTVVADLRHGKSLTLTYRGKPLARLLPVAPADEEISADDSIYTLADHAAAGAGDNGHMSNAQIDRILYGQP